MKLDRTEKYELRLRRVETVIQVASVLSKPARDVIENLLEDHLDMLAEIETLEDRVALFKEIYHNRVTELYELKEKLAAYDQVTGEQTP